MYAHLCEAAWCVTYTPTAGHSLLSDTPYTKLETPSCVPQHFTSQGTCAACAMEHRCLPEVRSLCAGPEPQFMEPRRYGVQGIFNLPFLLSAENLQVNTKVVMYFTALSFLFLWHVVQTNPASVNSRGGRDLTCHTQTTVPTLCCLLALLCISGKPKQHRISVHTPSLLSPERHCCPLGSCLLDPRSDQGVR
jgi:hypothetical protein